MNGLRMLQVKGLLVMFLIKIVFKDKTELSTGLRSTSGQEWFQDKSGPSTTRISRQRWSYNKTASDIFSMYLDVSLIVI